VGPGSVGPGSVGPGSSGLLSSLGASGSRRASTSARITASSSSPALNPSSNLRYTVARNRAIGIRTPRRRTSAAIASTRDNATPASSKGRS